MRSRKKFEEQMEKAGEQLCNTCNKYSKEEIEKFFGVVITVTDKEKSLYNVYVGGKLVLPEVRFDEVEYFVDCKIVNLLLNKLWKQAKQDENPEETRKLSEELEEEKKSSGMTSIYSSSVPRFGKPAYQYRGTITDRPATHGYDFPKIGKKRSE